MEDYSRRDFVKLGSQGLLTLGATRHGLATTEEGPVTGLKGLRLGAQQAPGCG